jgi:hypothetical protein
VVDSCVRNFHGEQRLQPKYPMNFSAVINVGFLYFFAHILAISFDGKPKCKNPLFITDENFIRYFMGIAVKNEMKKSIFFRQVF